MDMLMRSPVAARDALSEVVLRALEAAPQAVLVLARDGRPLLANAKACRLFGLPERAEIGPQHDGLPDLPDLLERIEAPGLLRALRERRDHWESVGALQAADGHASLRFCLCRFAVDDSDYWLLQVSDNDERQRVERLLQRRIDFEHLIARISAELMRAPASAMDAAIAHGLSLIGRFFGVDRAYVFRIAPDGASMSNTHEWVEEGVVPEADNLQRIPIDTFPWLMQQLRNDRAVLVPDVAALPTAAQAERSEFEREGIRSIAIVPMRRGEELSGFVGFDAVRSRIEWTDDFVLGLRLLAQLFVGALESCELALRLTELAFHDALTGLPNRQLLDDRLDQAIARSERLDGWLCVMLLDLDDFKTVNDRHGHAIGDRVLVEVATRLRAGLRESDTVARLGGDEFVLLLESSDAERAREVASRLQRALDEPICVDGRDLAIRASIGVALARGGAIGAAGLLRQADAAMYHAKREGKNQVAFAAAATDE